jgi:hypothetical protein
VTAHPETTSPYDGTPGTAPVQLLALITLGLVIISGIYAVAFLPERPPLWPCVVLVGAAAVLLIVNLILVSRLKTFNWHIFFLIGKWALFGYGVIGVMLGSVFVLDATSPELILLLSATLAIYAINIPLLLAYSVARYQPPV